MRKGVMDLGRALSGLSLLSGCAATGLPPPSSDIRVAYADWSQTEPAYRLYPGDEVVVTPLSAPELARTALVLPDGRITLPLIAPVMVADRTLQEAGAALTLAYGKVLQRPEVSVEVIRTAPLRIFVAGAVAHPGMIEMPGDVDALQAVMMAGGFETGAARDRVILVRRDRDGTLVRSLINLAAVLQAQRVTDATPLRRSDVLYVPWSASRVP
jgi:polysaccharide export outer membrane protein